MGYGDLIVTSIYDGGYAEANLAWQKNLAENRMRLRQSRQRQKLATLELYRLSWRRIAVPVAQGKRDAPNDDRSSPAYGSIRQSEKITFTN